jgi:DNA-binding IclR family transcriptional regulator
VDLLFAFTEEHPRRTARELSDAVGIPMPSVHRYVALLREIGLIADVRRGQYQLTPRVFGLSRAVHASNRILDIADPYLHALSIELNESVMLVQQIADQPLCVARHEAARAVRTSFVPGQAMQPLRGASAKVLLAGMAPQERRAYAARVDPTGSHGPAWEEEIEAIAAQGWATSDHELSEGVWAAAVPVTDHGRVVAAISVACPDFRMTPETRANVIDHARAAAAEISRELDVVPAPHAALTVPADSKAPASAQVPPAPGW